MARRTTPIGPEILRPTMAWHIRDLGLKDARAYLAWCREIGVAPSLEKSPAERTHELEIAARRKAAIEAQARLHRNPRRFLAEACAGQIDPAEVERPGWREVAAAIARSKDDADHRQSLADFLLHLERVSDLVFETAIVGRQPRLYVEG